MEYKYFVTVLQLIFQVSVTEYFSDYVFTELLTFQNRFMYRYFLLITGTLSKLFRPLQMTHHKKT